MDKKEIDAVWALHEVTRQGKNLCPKCNSPKRMYYNPWCPLCEKPQIEMVPCINFLMCMYHLEAIGHKGIKDRLWKDCCDSGAMKSNDSIMRIYFPTEEELSDEDSYDKESQIQKDWELVATTFNIKRGEFQHFHVSW